MNPKINGVSGGSPRIDGTQRPDDVKPGDRQAPTAGPAAADQVSLTDSAQLMVRLEQVMEDLPVVDRERVDSIKQAISDGTYSVNAQRVATEVLRMETDIGRR